MATVYARGGWLYLDFRWKGVRCQEAAHKRDTAANRGAVQKWARQIDGEIAADTFEYARHFPNGRKLKRFAPSSERPAPAPTLAEHARAWLETRRPWLAATTAYDRRRIIEAHLVPALGGRSVSTLTSEDVANLVTALKRRKGAGGAPLSNRRINMTLQVLRLCLDGAVRRGWLKDNPGRQVETLREERTDPDPFSLEEVTKLLISGLPADWPRRYFEVALFTGLRPSEQIGLRWADIDWTRDLIGVRRAVSRFGEGTTKTKGSVREVPMLPRAKLALQQQRGETKPDGAWVFPNERGGRLHIANLRERVWKPALRRAGLRSRTMYQIRHTFATLALSSGEALDWVARVLGHTTTAMVIRHYHKYVPNLTRRDGAALAAVLDRSLRPAAP
jgi:integrase